MNYIVAEKFSDKNKVTYAPTEAKWVLMDGFGGLVFNYFGETGHSIKVPLSVGVIEKALNRGANIFEITKVDKDGAPTDFVKLTLHYIEETDPDTGKVKKTIDPDKTKCNFNKDNGGIKVENTYIVPDIEAIVEKIFEDEAKKRLDDAQEHFKKLIEQSQNIVIEKKYADEYEEVYEKTKARIKERIDKAAKEESSATQTTVPKAKTESISISPVVDNYPNKEKKEDTTNTGSSTTTTTPKAAAPAATKATAATSNTQATNKTTNNKTTSSTSK